MKALIHNGEVVQLEATAFPVAPPLEWVPAVAGAQIGWTWDGTTMAAPVRILADVRKEKIEQIKTRRDADIATLMGIDVGEMDMLKIVYQNTDPAFHTKAMTSAYNIWTYAAGKIKQVKNATLTQLNAYDVATDPNWP